MLDNIYNGPFGLMFILLEEYSMLHRPITLPLFLVRVGDDLTDSWWHIVHPWEQKNAHTGVADNLSYECFYK